jgi:hypothetical protein
MAVLDKGGAHIASLGRFTLSETVDQPVDWTRMERASFFIPIVLVRPESIGRHWVKTARDCWFS